jgi:hypothetical protein
MLIEGIIKYTPPDHKDSVNLSLARTQVINVIHLIEKEGRFLSFLQMIAKYLLQTQCYADVSDVRDREHRERILYLQHTLALPSLFTGNEKRRLLFEGMQFFLVFCLYLNLFDLLFLSGDVTISSFSVTSPPDPENPLFVGISFSFDLFQRFI